MTTKCSWCEKVYHYVSKHEALCETCYDRYVEKRDFIGQKKGLPPDDTTEEEIWAMCFPNDSHAQEIMSARIERVKKQIQDNWTEEQRLSRAVQKKNDSDCIKRVRTLGKSESHLDEFLEVITNIWNYGVKNG